MGTKYQGTAEEISALNTYIALTRAAESVIDRTNHHLHNYHLSTSQFAVLEALYHLGTLSQVELARKLLKSTGNMTTVLQNLERAGLICRERDRDDQRYIRVSLLQAGRALVEQILPVHVAGIVRDLSVLTPDEQRQLTALCRKLGLQQRTDITEGK
ncbi:MarR family transcriptional regulator [Anaerolineae bacterium CFX9]|nr:MarR family transcriptional regulator [Anaerolineae bacterium CFX9]